MFRGQSGGGLRGSIYTFGNAQESIIHALNGLCQGFSLRHLSICDCGKLTLNILS